MDTYRENATCPKCLSADVSVSYCAGCYRYKRGDHDNERMHRGCRRCGYVWDELPAPAPAEEPKP